MATQVRDVIRVMDDWAPPQLAYSWDRSGLALGHPDHGVTGVLTCLTVTRDAFRAAKKARERLGLPEDAPAPAVVDKSAITTAAASALPTLKAPSIGNMTVARSLPAVSVHMLPRPTQVMSVAVTSAEDVMLKRTRR